MPLNSVLFPGMPMPLFIGEVCYRDMINECWQQHQPFGIVLMREDSGAEGEEEPHAIGTTAEVAQVEELEEGVLQILAVGRQRFRIDTLVQVDPYPIARVQLLEEESDRSASPELHGELQELFVEHLRLLMQLLGEPDTELSLPDTPGRLSYMVAAHLTAPPPVRQRLLEMNSVAERLLSERHLLSKESAEYRLLLAARAKYDQTPDDEWEAGVFSLN